MTHKLVSDLDRNEVLFKRRMGKDPDMTYRRRRSRFTQI